jgi:hypothetical protein
MRGWQLKDYRVYLSRASRKVPGKSTNPEMLGFDRSRFISLNPYFVSYLGLGQG